MNSTANSTKPLSPKELFLAELEPLRPYKADLSSYIAIGAYREAVLPLEKRARLLKLAQRTESYRVLATLGTNVYLI